MNRRGFLKSAVAGVGGMSALGSAVPETARAQGNPGEEAALKLSCQVWRIPGRNLREKIRNFEKWGGHAIELRGGGLAGRVDDLKKALRGTRIKVSAICAGYDGILIHPDGSVRKKCVQSMKEILTAAGELGSTGLIVVPAFNRHEQLQPKEARKVLLDLLPELGEHAHEHGTRVLLEPLNRGEAFFLRMLADAAAICRDVGHPGVCLMGDFYHMYIEETSDLGAFLSAGKWCHHVHLASRTRKLPGQDERSFVQGFRGLKLIGYRDYCSFECGVKGDPMVEMPKSMEFLRKQWKQATIGNFKSLIDLRSEE